MLSVNTVINGMFSENNEINLRILEAYFQLPLMFISVTEVVGM